MTDRMISPERVKRVDPYEVSKLNTAIGVIEFRDRALADELVEERKVLSAHRGHMDAFADRMKFGSAVSWHSEAVMDWLIEQGWTPPAGLLMQEGADR